jgi:hypothetical protein
VRCIDWAQRIGALALLAACSSPTPPPAPAGPTAARPAPSPSPAAPTPPAAPANANAVAARLGPPKAVRSWNEVRAQAALRIVAANPEITFTGTVPDLLLAIPVLEVELNADGSVRRIDVLRQPAQARDTVQLAIDAVNRAAPFGDVSRLPKPWKFVETFLFNDQRKFKPRTLDS